MGWSKLVDLELDDEDMMDSVMPIPMGHKPRYPYGTRICLTHTELAKLGLDLDCEIGDMIDMRCFGVVTSISKNDTESGSDCRVEIQIEKMKVEAESTESEDDKSED